MRLIKKYAAGSTMNISFDSNNANQQKLIKRRADKNIESTVDIESNPSNGYSFKSPNAINEFAFNNQETLKVAAPVKPREETDVLKVAAETVPQAINIANTYKDSGKSKADKVTAGIQSGGLIAGVIGNELSKETTNKNKEILGGTLTGVSRGVAMGSTAGSLAGPIGTLIGAGAGAVAGGIIGGVKAKKTRDTRIIEEGIAAAKFKKTNEDIAERNRQSLGHAKEQQDYANIMSSLSKSYKNGGKLIPRFRRGGELDLEKENVILDGPSHNDHNSTGVRNDKGLPVVKGGIKIAEIESLELILNKTSSKEVEKLVKEYKTNGDKKVLDKIGKMIKSEINDNTYDYSKELIK